jgi:PAS domain S-box-containing protein
MKCASVSAMKERKMGEKGRLPSTRGKEILSSIATVAIHQVSIRNLQRRQNILENENEKLKRSLVSLKNAQQNFYDLYHTSPLIQFDLDSKGCIQQINDTGVKLFRLKRSLLRGFCLSNFVVASDLPKFWRHLRECVNLQECSTELRIRCQDQEDIVQLKSRLVVQNQKNLCRTVVINLTRAKQIETSLRSNEQRFKAVSEISSDFAYAFRWSNDQFECDWMTNAFTRITGFSLKSFAQKGWEHFILPEDLKGYQSRFEAIKRGHANVREFRIRTRQGGIKWICDIIKPARKLDDHSAYFYGASRDVTIQKEAELELRRAHQKLESKVQARTYELNQLNQALKESNKELETFAYVASHDLKEPLRMIVSYSQLLNNQYKAHLDLRANEYIGYIVDGAKKMYHLVNDILGYSRLGRDSCPEWVSSEEVLKEALDALRFKIEETETIISYPQMPIVSCRRSELRQLFQNLIDNAIKFCGKGSPLIRISCERQDSFWKFSIQDNGIGIEPQFKSRIFEMFQRLHPSDYEGTGIGLTTCKKIVNHHGGQIWVESEPQRGSIFHFTLAASGCEASPLEISTDADPDSDKTPRVGISNCLLQTQGVNG